MSFPRTLLLTRWAPDARYAGGEDLRKRVSLLPPENVRWASLSRPVLNRELKLPEHRSFQPAILHWRLQSSALQHFYLHAFQAAPLARAIAEWARPFDPQVLWIGSDMETIAVGTQVARLLRVPLHVTAYDAFEACRFFGVPGLFRWYYLRQVRECLRMAATLDAVSTELVDHLRAGFCGEHPGRTMVFPPSVALSELPGPPEYGLPESPDEPRRIGFCGAARESAAQWQAFLSLLHQLEWRFEIEVFSDPDYFPKVPPPANVSIRFQPYEPTEQSLVRRMRELKVHVCYLGLWKEKEKRLFAGTSLSSKLTAYAAAGLPVIVNAPEDSVAWRLVRKHGAGVLVRGQKTEDRGQRTEDRGQRTEDRGQVSEEVDIELLTVNSGGEPGQRKISPCQAPITGNHSLSTIHDSLSSLFGDQAAWRAMAEGSARMCREEYDLKRNMQEFRELLAVAAEDRGRKTEDGRQRTEHRRQRTEDRGRKTEDRRQRTEDRRREG